jgi:hypothetical protein
MGQAIIKKIANAVNPPLQIGGLEVTDSYIRYVAIKGRKADFISVKLAPGIIEDGKIKDKGRLFTVLDMFHGRIAGKKKRVWVVASISDSNVYTEIFTLPKTATKNLKEAAELNLQMISPIDFNTAHADWHLVGEKELNGVAQNEILGAFIAKQFVEEFEQIADAAGFEIVAIEFPMFALARSIAEMSDQFDHKKNYLVFRLGSDGISFGLVKSGELYFLHFVGWDVVYGSERKATLASLKKTIVDEIHKILSFYETHWEGMLTNLFLVTPTFEDEISAAIAENFPNLIVEIPSLRQFKDLSIGWFSTLGSAFRGIIPRDEDNMISLATTDTQNKYDAYQATNFVRLWRNISVAVLGGILALFIVVNVFLGGVVAKLQRQSGEIAQNPAIGKLAELQQEATVFNKKVGMLTRAQQERSHWSDFFADMQAMGGPSVTIKRISIQSLDIPVTIFGEAVTQAAIGDFEKALKANARITDVKFQFSSVVPIEGGKYGFSMSFKLKN